jgi:aminoglycoside phosphotransferase family enzyme/predicted kinase
MTQGPETRLLATAPRQLPDALLRADAWPHPVRELRLVETHISWVFLTGDYAYKVKKPLDLGFLDFSTLERRQQACTEELRLNRRLAPDLYLAVVPIGIANGQLCTGAGGEPVEYAVRMRQFPDHALLADELAAGRLTAADLRELAGTIAAFHADLPPAPPTSPAGSPERVWAPLAQSLGQLAELGAGNCLDGGLPTLAAALRHRFEALVPLLEQRQACGMIRECHGDLHLGNLVRLDRGIAAFDALEFDAALRWTDVMAEVAFLLMDLCVRDRQDLAMVFLNEYLSRTGDYAGVRLLPLYLAYRALVRAKVMLLAPVADEPARASAAMLVNRLLRFAQQPSLQVRNPTLVLVCGASGTGKSWLSGRLAPWLPALHLRSDVERKRLAGLPALARSDSAVGGGLYAPAMSNATYQRLATLAAGLLQSGFHVIVDAAALTAARREQILHAAGPLPRRTALVWLEGPPALLAGRIDQRSTRGADPSEADRIVLEQQLRMLERPRDDEAAQVVRLDAASDPDPAALATRLVPR